MNGRPGPSSRTGLGHSETPGPAWPAPRSPKSAEVGKSVKNSNFRIVEKLYYMQAFEIADSNPSKIMIRSPFFSSEWQFPVPHDTTPAWGP